jgi:hypothetical protein
MPVGYYFGPILMLVLIGYFVFQLQRPDANRGILFLGIGMALVAAVVVVAIGLSF